MKNQTHSTIDKSEIENFNKSSKSWWDKNGDAKPLHAFNMVRVPLIREGLISTGAVDKNYINTSKVLKGINILEIGCGGGILSEVILFKLLNYKSLAYPNKNYEFSSIQIVISRHWHDLMLM